jgi:hypothetical protein
MEMVALAGTAASLAGGYTQYQANESRAEEQRKASMAELLRQDKIDEDKQRNFQDALGIADRDTQMQALDDATADREALFSGNAKLPGDDATYTSPAAGGPKVVQEYADKEQGAADDFVSMLGDARARMGAWGDGMFEFGQGMDEFSWRNREKNRQAGRSAQIGKMGAEQAARETGNKTALFGNVLSSVGTGLSGYAGANGGYGRLLGSGDSAGGLTEQIGQTKGLKQLASPVLNRAGGGSSYY